jgi:hypothetical protein
MNDTDITIENIGPFVNAWGSKTNPANMADSPSVLRVAQVPPRKSSLGVRNDIPE